MLLAATAWAGAVVSAPSSVCLPAEWPQFSSADELAGDPWGKYLLTVYRTIPSDPSMYPWCAGDAWMLYDAAVEASNITNIPVLGQDQQCPILTNGTANATAEGQRYLWNNYVMPPGTSWSWHPASPTNWGVPRTPFPNGSWVEVSHAQDEWTDEKTGAWFFFAKGSGIWFNLGSTISFKSHTDGYSYFNVSLEHPDCASHVNITQPNECMCHLASLAGFDSIQFTDSMVDACPCLSCCPCTRVPTSITANMNIELVSTKLQGIWPCASEDGRSALIRSGWAGAQPCTCNNSVHSRHLNCAEVPPSSASSSSSAAGLREWLSFFPNS